MRERIDGNDPTFVRYGLIAVFLEITWEISSRHLGALAAWRLTIVCAKYTSRNSRRMGDYIENETAVRTMRAKEAGRRACSPAELRPL